jgi:ATP-binding protein involved in chromosome partitioning
MITDPDSPGAVAFRTSAKNIAAQCSIQAAKLQEEMKSESSSKESEDTKKESAPEVSTSN